MKQPTARQLARRVEKWNRDVPIGAVVTYRSVKAARSVVITTTRTAAEVLSGHTPVVWLTGVSGCVALDHTEPLGAINRGISIGDKWEPAMKITEQAAADAYFERCVEHSLATGAASREEAEKYERDNIGYWAGYYDNETRERVERLFNCAHPVFGRIAEVGPPTPAEALAAGIARGLKIAGCT
jgi:hypothetical protein